MSAINDIIRITTLGATHIFTNPNEYEYGYWLPSVVGTNAEGKPYIQLLNETALREWRLTWVVMSDDQMHLAQSAWEGLSSQVCQFIDVFNNIYSVTRHPDQQNLEIEEVKTAAAVRWRVTMRLIKSNDAYEV